MSLDRTKKQLIELLGNTDNQVIALAGRWGTGKTHLWNEVQAESKNESKKALYISLFGLSSIDQVKRKLMEGALPDAAVGGGKLEVFKNLFKSGVHAATSHYKALAAINDLNLLLMAPLALKERVIVIDDIERKHAKLGMDEILGFVDEYSTQFKVRFVLVLNDDQLETEGAQRALWTTFREKVIDHEIRLSTTPDEAFSIAIKLAPSPKYEETLKRAVLTCGLTNIRIIVKVIRATNKILASRDLIGPIQARVVPSIVLFAAIHHRGLEDGPDFLFALNVGNPDLLNLPADETDESTEKKVRNDRWRMLMNQLGIHNCDDFEKILVEFLESGLLESEKVQAIIDRYVGEERTFDARQKVSTFIRKATWDYRMTDADLITEATGLLAVTGELDPYVATELHSTLSELAGGQRLAEQVIQTWNAAIQVRGGLALGDNNPFGTHLHPAIRATVDAAVAQRQAQTTVVEACNHIVETKSWGTLQELTMKKARVDDFESAIRTLAPEDLARFLGNMTEMRLQRDTYESHFGYAASQFMRACRTIVNDPAPETPRLAEVIRKWFAKTSLASELKPEPQVRSAARPRTS